MAATAPSPAAPAGPLECDLVMKGGITSGVIYPRLVSTLARKYRFRNIGGTSAGAIAAGASAAAEYGRQHGRAQAFDELAALPGELNSTDNPSGHTRLFTLFQPVPAVRAHFAALVGALNRKPADAAFAIGAGMLKMFAGPAAALLALGSLLQWPFVQVLAPGRGHGLVALLALLVAVVAPVLGLQALRAALGGQRLPAAAWGVAALAAPAALLALLATAPLTVHLAGGSVGMALVACLLAVLVAVLAVLRFGSSLLAGLHGNGYGLCSGRTQAGGAGPGLTDWLTAYFNRLAGLPEDGDPLTFGDLWGPPNAEGRRAINLEVVTSAVSQQMVYGIPFRDGTPQMFYDPDEWNALFPPAVMRWLERAAPADIGLPPGAAVVSAAGKPMRPLPANAQLPVVVAVRMSLSFPVLLSAVPLHAVDWSLKANHALRDTAAKAGAAAAVRLPAKRVWFSDGGIGSNLPLHMFDALLPGHPTFAVNLKAEHPDFPIATPETPLNSGGRIYLPDNNLGGRQRFWTAPADGQPLPGLVGFLGSIVGTMQNWRDEILFPYPGFRDRIVQISQRADEGGLNLDMPAERIDSLAHAGEMAAARLIDRFHPEGAEGGAGWRNHQLVRLGTFLGTLQPGSAALCKAQPMSTWAGRVDGLQGYNAAMRTLAGNFLDGLGTLGALGEGVSLERGAMKPLAQIRITPRI